MQRTRAFNGGLVGPTLRVKPGDTLTVALTNSLAAEGFDTGSLHNDYRQVDTTNLHTHAPHGRSAVVARPQRTATAQRHVRSSAVR